MNLKKGDITKETVDVIVNSNNSSLDLGTGMLTFFCACYCVAFGRNLG